MAGVNLLGEPEPTLLPADPAAALLAGAGDPAGALLAEAAGPAAPGQGSPATAGAGPTAAGDPTPAAGPNQVDLAAVAAAHPRSSLAWAALAEQALSAGRTVEGYAYARTGYHRGLDALRQAGWRGHGPVPWEHEPNRGFLRALAALGRAAAAIGEQDEAERVEQFLADASPTAAGVLAQASE